MGGDKFILLFLLFALASCQQASFKDSKALTSYLKDSNNGYSQTKEIKGYTFSLMLQPTDLLVDRELDSVYSPKSIERLRIKYKPNLYLNVGISKDGDELLNNVPNDRANFTIMLKNLVFEMHKKVHLYNEKKDTIPLVDYVYPRMYGMSNATSMLFVFPRDEKFEHSEQLIFAIEDFGLMTGEVKFKLDAKKIKKEPIINFEY